MVEGVSRDRQGQRKRRVRVDRVSAETTELTIAAELGNVDVVGAMREALSHPHSTQSSPALTNPPIHSIKSTQHLVSIFVHLGRALIDDEAAQWSRVVMYRIHAACSYHVYEAAKVDVDRSRRDGVASVFLQYSARSLSDQQSTPWTQLPPRCKAATAVRDRLTDLIFLDGRLDTPESRKRTRRALETQQQLGKRWTHIIRQLGYVVITLLPASVTSYRMTITEPQLANLIRLLAKHMAQIESTVREDVHKAIKQIFMPQVEEYQEVMSNSTGFTAVLHLFGRRERQYFIGHRQGENEPYHLHYHHYR